MKDREAYWKWHRHHIPRKWRGAAESKRREISEQERRDAPALALYAERKAALPKVIRRRPVTCFGELAELINSRRNG